MALLLSSLSRRLLLLPFRVFIKIQNSFKISHFFWIAIVDMQAADDAGRAHHEYKCNVDEHVCLLLIDDSSKHTKAAAAE